MGDCVIQRMFETAHRPGCSQRSKFVWHRSFMKRKKLMKDKDRKIRGRASKGERRQQAILNQTKDKKGFDYSVGFNLT